MKWYADYLSIYDKPFTQAPQAVINQVKDKIRQLATHAPLVSVVAIAHNEEKRILSCLWSLCENQHNYPVEILVINNHSTDHTEEVLKELGVTYFNEYRKGPGFARQCGLNHARGKYHLCIDADTLYPPQYISTMIKVLQDKYNPQIQISVVSGTKRSIFRQKNKTKRSKKRLHTTLIKPEQKVNEDLCSGFIVS